MRWRLYASGRVSLLSINTISTPDHCRSRSPSSNVSWRHRARLRPPCPRRSRHRPSAFSHADRIQRLLKQVGASLRYLAVLRGCTAARAHGADDFAVHDEREAAFARDNARQAQHCHITCGAILEDFRRPLEIVGGFCLHLRDTDTCNLRVVEPLEGNQVSSIIDDCNRHIPVILPRLRLSGGETLACTLEVYCAAIRLSVCGTRCTSQA